MEPAAIPLPLPLQAFISLNSEFKVLICLVNRCYSAIEPAVLASHLLRKHEVGKKTREEANQYIKQWQWPYDSKSIILPPNGSAPQPVIPVLDGYQCLWCEYITQSRKAGREHGNKAHQLKRVPDKELVRPVQIQ